MEGVHCLKLAYLEDERFLSEEVSHQIIDWPWLWKVENRPACDATAEEWPCYRAKSKELLPELPNL